MTPQSSQARADFSRLESNSYKKQATVDKPQVRLVKIDGKLVAVPVQVDEPARTAKAVQKERPLQTIKPVPTSNPLEMAKPGQANESLKTDRTSTLSYGPGATLQDLLQQAIGKNASDLHVHSGAAMRIRVDGKLCDATPEALSPQACEQLIMGMLSDAQIKQLEEKFQVDFAYDIQGVGRFRANIYKQQRGYDAVFRTIKPSPPTLEELGLPRELSLIHI